MWLCEGEDLTRDSEVQQPDPPRPLVQRGTHLSVTEYIVWGGYGTDRAIEGIKNGATDTVDGYTAQGVLFLVPSGTNFHLELSHAVHTRLRKY